MLSFVSSIAVLLILAAPGGEGKNEILIMIQIHLRVLFNEVHNCKKSISTLFQTSLIIKIVAINVDRAGVAHSERL